MHVLEHLFQIPVDHMLALPEYMKRTDDQLTYIGRARWSSSQVRPVVNPFLLARTTALCYKFPVLLYAEVPLHYCNKFVKYEIIIDLVSKTFVKTGRYKRVEFLASSGDLAHGGCILDLFQISIGMANHETSAVVECPVRCQELMPTPPEAVLGCLAV